MRVLQVGGPGIVTISGMTERDSMASSPKLEEVRELARKLA